jgi:hypothetical protein
VLIAVMVAAAAFTYKTKHDAEDKYSEVRKLEGHPISGRQYRCFEGRLEPADSRRDCSVLRKHSPRNLNFSLSTPIRSSS